MPSKHVNAVERQYRQAHVDRQATVDAVETDVHLPKPSTMRRATVRYRSLFYRFLHTTIMYFRTTEMIHNDVERKMVPLSLTTYMYGVNVRRWVLGRCRCLELVLSCLGWFWCWFSAVPSLEGCWWVLVQALV